MINIKKRKALLISQFLFFTSIAIMFAPATLTANAQSVTVGSIFKFYLGLTNSLRFLLLKFNPQISKFKV